MFGGIDGGGAVTALTLDMSAAGEAKFNDNIVMGTAGKGIHLGVTSATASNLLDDYEEGSFTPAYSQSGGDVLRTGRYTKVGNMVTIFIRAQYTQTSSSTALGKITGLPFTILDETGLTSAIFREFSTTGDLYSTSINGNSTETNALRNFDNAATFTAGAEIGVGLEFSYRVA